MIRGRRRTSPSPLRATVKVKRRDGAAMRAAKAHGVPQPVGVAAGGAIRLLSAPALIGRVPAPPRRRGSSGVLRETLLPWVLRNRRAASLPRRHRLPRHSLRSSDHLLLLLLLSPRKAPVVAHSRRPHRHSMLPRRIRQWQHQQQRHQAAGAVEALAGRWLRPRRRRRQQLKQRQQSRRRRRNGV